MCEPHHSFVQVSRSEIQDRNYSLSSFDVGSWRKRQIDGHYHWTRLGGGHSKAIAECGNNNGAFSLSQHTSRRAPHVKWEVAWWHRALIFDSAITPEGNTIAPYNMTMQGRERYGKDSDCFKAGLKYGHVVSIGTIQGFRRFLEGSLKTTNTPESYILRFFDMLKPDRRDHFAQRMLATCKAKKCNHKGEAGIVNAVRDFTGDSRNILSRGDINDRWCAKEKVAGHIRKAKKEQVIKTVMGFTRRRDNFIPEWSDPNEIWCKA